MAAPKEVALRKRQQIANANRTMFLWVAAASVVIGFAVVAAVFLLQKLTFNEKVLAEKTNTVQTLEQNNANIDELKDNVRLLSTNPGLNAAKADSDDGALQVVLDALPADANSLALGASLQQNLLGEVDGLTLESATIDTVEGVESSDGEANVEEGSADEDEAEDTTHEITFRLAVSGSANALQNLLERFERSIRVIDVTALTLERSSGKLTMTIEAQAFYEPARTVELEEKVVTP